MPVIGMPKKVWVIFHVLTTAPVKPRIIPHSSWVVNAKWWNGDVMLQYETQLIQWSEIVEISHLTEFFHIYIYNPYHKLLFYIGTIVLIKIVHWLKSKVDQLHSLNLCDVRLLDRRHRQLRHSRRRVLRSRQRLDQSPVAAKTQRDRTPQRHPNG